MFNFKTLGDIFAWQRSQQKPELRNVPPQPQPEPAPEPKPKAVRKPRKPKEIK